MDALIVGMTKGLVDNESFESTNNAVEGDLNDVAETRDDMVVIASLLEQTKQSFIQL